MFIGLTVTCFAFLIQIILVARRGEHRHIVKITIGIEWYFLAVKWI